MTKLNLKLKINQKIVWLTFVKLEYHIHKIFNIHLNIHELEYLKYDNLSQIVLHSGSSIGSTGSWVPGFSEFLRVL